MPEPVGFAVIRTKKSSGHRHVVFQWTTDAPPHYGRDETWRKMFPDTEHFAYTLHAIEGEPLAEAVTT